MFFLCCCRYCVGTCSDPSSVQHAVSPPLYVQLCHSGFQCILFSSWPPQVAEQAAAQTSSEWSLPGKSEKKNANPGHLKNDCKMRYGISLQVIHSLTDQSDIFLLHSIWHSTWHILTICLAYLLTFVPDKKHTILYLLAYLFTNGNVSVYRYIYIFFGIRFL